MLGAFITAIWNNEQKVEVIGFKSKIPVYTKHIIVNTKKPQYFLFDWKDIDKLYFKPYGGVSAGFESDSPSIAIDNLIFDPLCDDNVCTTDKNFNVVDFTCTHEAVICDDGIDCTNDTCNPTYGCVFTPACDDGNPCTIDTCNPALNMCTYQNFSSCDGKKSII